MTLEEKAEEYIEKNCNIWEEGELTVDEIVRLAYLAGAKENGVIWHDLRKDPKDLPRIKKNEAFTCVLIYHKDWYDVASYNGASFFSCGQNITGMVTAWCYIPQFKE